MTRTLEADLATIPDVVGIAARTVVALPPSDLDPATVIDGTVYDATTTYDATTAYYVTFAYQQMRVRIGGVEIHRDYDPEMS